MAGAFVQIEVNDRGLTELVSSITRHLSDMTPVFHEIGEVVAESVQRNFEEHKAPDGKKWEELSPAYAAWKAKKGKNAADILILNRILMGSIHQKAQRDRVQVGTDVVYGAVHQFGMDKFVGVAAHGRGKWQSTGGRSGATTQTGVRTHLRDMFIPARPFLGIRDDDWPEIRAAVETFLVT